MNLACGLVLSAPSVPLQYFHQYSIGVREVF